jgi:hypothetical protein
MRMIVAVIAGLLVQVAVKGTVSSKAASMPVVDTVAVWDPAKGELRVSMMPFTIQNKHLAHIREGSTMFAVLEEKTPDAKKWADWCPGAEVKIKLDPKELAKGPAAVKSYHLWVYGLEKRNFTDNVNRGGEELAKEFPKLVVKLDAKGTGTFEMEFSGNTSSDDSTSWNVSLKGNILAPGK